MWLAEATGQSVADLLAVPATVYGAMRQRVIETLRDSELAAYRAERQDQWDRLMETVRGAR